MPKPQTTASLYMVEPTTFGFDEQTAVTNSFQEHLLVDAPEITRRACEEFRHYVATLRAHDIEVITFRDTDPGRKPNAVFPNNWFTTWPDGTVYLYPMATPSRRVERSATALAPLQEKFQIKRTVDISAPENSGAFLEGSGVLVFDHANKVAYACLSVRCDKALLEQHIAALGYQLVVFHTTDPSSAAIYHTNVMLGIQSKTAVVYDAGIIDPTERMLVVDSLATSGHQLIHLTFEQVSAFCGNVLNVQNVHGEQFVVLSQAAFDAFTPAQRKTLSLSGTLLPVSIPTIEHIGGGSARCMLAEIFLPRK